MVNNGLERLSEIYERLDEGDKEKVIRLAESLLNSQNIMNEENKEDIQTVESKISSKRMNDNTTLNSRMRV